MLNKTQAKNTIVNDSDFFKLSNSFKPELLYESKKPITKTVIPVTKKGIIWLYSFNKIAINTEGKKTSPKYFAIKPRTLKIKL